MLIVVSKAMGNGGLRYVVVGMMFDWGRFGLVLVAE